MHLFGHTRSTLQRNHALITPDSHVRAKIPGWQGASLITLISPQMGARFLQYLADVEPGGRSSTPADGIERFAYVIDGEVDLHRSSHSITLGVGGYAYLPPGTPHSITANESSRLLLYEKRYQPLHEAMQAPEPVTNQVMQVSSEPFLGDENARLQILLPDEPAFDMAVNIFTFYPGAAHPFVEVHVMEHGLLMLSGGGIYRLDDKWYPVQAGDTIWMGPYCAQWFCAVGKNLASYIYYKDVNRDPFK